MKNKLFKTFNLKSFSSKDIGKVFWRVGYQGILTQCLISDVKENSEAIIKLAMLTNLTPYEYKLNDNVEYYGTSTYGIEVLQKDDEFYYDFEKAKKQSLERFNKEVNPNGKYKVGRYFDNIFETYVTDILSKKEARKQCKKFNFKSRHYVSYDIVNI